jgi:glutathione S-transferase
MKVETAIKKQILDYIDRKHPEPVYPSDIAELFESDYFWAQHIMEELEQEGLIKIRQRK